MGRRLKAWSWRKSRRRDRNANLLVGGLVGEVACKKAPQLASRCVQQCLLLLHAKPLWHERDHGKFLRLADTVRHVSPGAVAHIDVACRLGDNGHACKEGRPTDSRTSGGRCVRMAAGPLAERGSIAGEWAKKGGRPPLH